MYTQISTGVNLRPNSGSTNTIQKRIDTLMVRYNNNDINDEQLLDNLSLLIARKALTLITHIWTYLIIYFF